MSGLPRRLPRRRHGVRAAGVRALISCDVHWDMAAAAVHVPRVPDLSARASGEEVVHAAHVQPCRAVSVPGPLLPLHGQREQQAVTVEGQQRRDPGASLLAGGRRGPQQRGAGDRMRKESETGDCSIEPVSRDGCWSVLVFSLLAFL